MQSAAAGLVPVITEQVATYQRWHAAMYQNRRIAEAHILITRQFCFERGNELVPANRVAVVDGWGNTLGSITVPCSQVWDAQSKNRLGQTGAYIFVPDSGAIEEAISDLREEHPEFISAPEQDNNQEMSR
jgi:hypothetical protein